ncbi:MAG: formylglycine-generating enzyme family protein [Candidatus Cloacimonetes bacterium]|nr:formylglycine-generating enzyme family protein [Candidatus Cloacimonadota bacterium]MDD3096581.1 formylglycine-generating enzyme family protein [Candidatus Cloacimonadota bacterium]MDD4034324.1 formylglycine-generating enzyme family protein [Candidatus Cloacimonadota bacterium]MDD4666755.1 formylglycine-generating enzyme family protein [Candidatus Cloacimonadota bacterium]
MKHMMFVILFILALAYGYASQPVVSNVLASYSSGNVAISYDLIADDMCQITVVLSSDSGASYTHYPSAISGDVGDQVSPGNGKQILWHPVGDGIGAGEAFMVKIIARDNPLHNEEQYASFVRVDEGTLLLQGGDATIGSFYIDRYEVTQNEFHAVMGTNPSNFPGNPNRPVEMVSWFDAIEYCNRRSLQEKIPPCYSYGSYGTNPDNWPSGWKLDDQNQTLINCDWNAHGYRLLAEVEYMYVSFDCQRKPANIYCGGPDIDSVAWYLGNSDINDGNGVRTHDVGLKNPNLMGAYDMSGNVWEWVWDVFGAAPIQPPNAPPASGSNKRAFRGGSFSVDHQSCCATSRFPRNPSDNLNNVGFRVSRSGL